VRQQWLHLVVVSAGLTPALSLVWRAAFGDLGANPIEEITHETGECALRLLLLTLAVTPVRQLLGWRRIAPFRRTLGLLTFSYASLHLATFFVLDLGLDLSAFGEEVIERPYITAGLTAFTLLVPLAVTSTRGWMRHLGRRWVTLHRLIYPAAIAATVHFWWLVKADLTEPIIYATLLALLLALRLPPALQSRKKA